MKAAGSYSYTDGTPQPGGNVPSEGVLGSHGIGETLYHGFIKCKLVHAPYGSLVVPDQVFMDDEDLHWFQPLSFMASQSWRREGSVHCLLWTDIEGGHTLEVRFDSAGFIGAYGDGSFLYRCSIKGPANLCEQATGTSRRFKGGCPFLKLYHFTTEESKRSIVTSREFRGSKWNLQGSKKLSNITYAYLTSLPRIQTRDDLARIAMAPDQKLYLIRDDSPVLTALPNNWREVLGEDILEVRVYWSTPEARQARLTVWVEASALSPQHLWRHAPRGSAAWYEIARPAVYRVGTAAGSALPLQDGLRLEAGPPVLSLAYLVMGDARCLDGLAAPFDEENTDHILKVDRLAPGAEPLTYWFAHANTDIYSGLALEFAEFEGNSSESE